MRQSRRRKATALLFRTGHRLLCERQLLPRGQIRLILKSRFNKKRRLTTRAVRLQRRQAPRRVAGEALELGIAIAPERHEALVLCRRLRGAAERLENLPLAIGGGPEIHEVVRRVLIERAIPPQRLLVSA